MGKIRIRTVCALLLAFLLLPLGGCSLLYTPSDEGNGTTQTPDTGNTGETDEEPEQPAQPETGDGDETVTSAPPLPPELNFTPTAVTEKYGYAYFWDMPNGKGYCNFYEDLYQAANDCKQSEEDIAATKLSVSDREISVYIIDTLNFKQYGLTAEEAQMVWKTFRGEYPEFYWLENQITYSTSGGTFNLQMFPEYALHSTRAAIDEKIESAANQAFGYLTAEMSVTERALTLYDYVVTALEYAYETDGVTPQDDVWAHNIVGWADGSEGVCETYAKTYDYLCGLVGIECITVTGYAGTTSDDMGGHAWNIVQIDGVWYTVDTTWGDSGSTLSREWFGEKASVFAQTHVADMPIDTFGMDWQYALPTLSDTKLSPVRMSVDGEGNTIYGCIDYAFAKMTNAGSRYALTLYPDTAVTTAKSALVKIEGASFTTSDLPAVSQLSFIGKTLGVTKAALTAENSVVLHGNVVLNKVSFSYPTITKNGYTLSNSGWLF